MEKKDPRLAALEADKSSLEEMVNHPGWRVLNRMIREIQVQETRVLKTGKDSQPLFQAQGVLLGFEKLSEMVEQLVEANEDALKLLLPKEE